MKYRFTPADGSAPIEFETDAELPPIDGSVEPASQAFGAEPPGGPVGTDPK